VIRTKVNAYRNNVFGIRKEKSPKNHGRKGKEIPSLQNNKTLEVNAEKGAQTPNHRATDHLNVERAKIRIELTGRIVNRITRRHE